MIDAKLGEVESRFADLIWSNAPISSGALSKLAEQTLGWKKTTAFTVLNRVVNAKRDICALLLDCSKN